MFCRCVCRDNELNNHGSNGRFHCINGGTIGGGLEAAPAHPNAALNYVEQRRASQHRADDGSTDAYCINGGTVGHHGSCTCTSCNVGYSGLSCQTANLHRRRVQRTMAAMETSTVSTAVRSVARREAAHARRATPGTAEQASNGRCVCRDDELSTQRE